MVKYHLIWGHLFPSDTSDKEQKMLTRARPFGLTMAALAALLVLTLVPGAPVGHAAGEPFDWAQDRPLGPTTAAPPEPLSALSDTEATEPHLSDFSAPSAPSVVQDEASQQRTPDALCSAPAMFAENAVQLDDEIHLQVRGGSITTSSIVDPPGDATPSYLDVLSAEIIQVGDDLQFNMTLNGYLLKK